MAYNILHLQLRLTTYRSCIGVMFCMWVPLKIALIHFELTKARNPVECEILREQGTHQFTNTKLELLIRKLII